MGDFITNVLPLFIFHVFLTVVTIDDENNSRFEVTESNDVDIFCVSLIKHSGRLAMLAVFR